jgi:hypothetical protein|tara:strand:+ start:1160 stop:1546 length:387 start_codon:yes stop_codon:yes gene_type:complete
MADKNVEVGGYESVLTGKTEEETEEIKATARELSKVPEINLAIASGITSCRLYVTVRMVLQRLLADRGYSSEDGIEEVFLKVINDKAHDKFSLEELSSQLEDHVKLFISEQIEQSNNEEEPNGELSED